MSDHARLDNPVPGQLALDAFDYVMMPRWEAWAAEINLDHLMRTGRVRGWSSGIGSPIRFVRFGRNDGLMMTDAEIALLT